MWCQLTLLDSRAMSWRDEPGMEHMRDDAPFRLCSDCGRHSWSEGEGAVCGVPQPGDGAVCRGTFGPLSNERVIPKLVDRATDEGREAMAVVQVELDQMYAESIDLLRKQSLEGGVFMLFVAAVDEDGDEGVRLISGGHVDAPEKVAALVMNSLGAVIDVAKSMGLIPEDGDPA